MIPRRRLTLQLTPLLDMLLIVVFLQYFQLREREISLEGEQQVVAEQQAATRTEVQDLLARMEELRTRLQTAESQTEVAQDLANEERRRSSQVNSNLDRVVDQQVVIGQLVNKLFQISPDDVNQILDATRTPGDPLSEEDRQRLLNRLQEIASQSPGRVIEHLLSYDEIRKRCDVWDLHLDAQGVATLTSDQRTSRLRIPINDEGDLIQDQFVTEMFHWYRSLPQTKTLVVILLTYDRNSRIYMTDSVRQSLPLWVRQMQEDGQGRSRFEYADLGFRIE